MNTPTRENSITRYVSELTGGLPATCTYKSSYAQASAAAMRIGVLIEQVRRRRPSFSQKGRCSCDGVLTKA